MSAAQSSRDMAYRLGHDVLGPVFASFARILVHEASRRGIARLVFLARDGHLLLQATAGLLDAANECARPELAYVRVSRRVAALAALQELDAKALEAGASVRSGEPTLRKSLEYLGLDCAPLAPWLDRHGLAADLAPSPAALQRLLADHGFRQVVANQATEQRMLLHRYLAQEGALSAIPAAWVDIGWRATIQRHFDSAFVDSRSIDSMPWFYFALWDEHGPPPQPRDAIGLIGDQRRGNGLLEASPRHLAHLLEAICRADEGTAIGYELNGETVVPRLLDGKGRQAEVAGNELAECIRAGILDRVRQLGADPKWHRQTDDRLRAVAQSTLLRLAFFPNSEEIAIGRQLSHTEGHASDWHASLILAGQHPLRSPRSWLAGMASPWRGGYVAASGGPALAAAYFAFEAVMSVLPGFVSGWLADLARRMAGIPPLGDRETGKPPT